MDRQTHDRLSDNHAITTRIPRRASAGAASRVAGQHLRSFPAETAQQAIRPQRHPERVLSLSQVLTLHQHAETRQHRLDHRQRPRTYDHLGLPAWPPQSPFHDHIRLLRHLAPTLRADADGGPGASITQPTVRPLARDATHLQAARQLLRSLLRRLPDSGNARHRDVSPARQLRTAVARPLQPGALRVVLPLEDRSSRIDRSRPLLLSEQVADDLRADITSGEITGRLPGEHELAAQYGSAG